MKKIVRIILCLLSISGCVGQLPTDRLETTFEIFVNTTGIYTLQESCELMKGSLIESRDSVESFGVILSSDGMTEVDYSAAEKVEGKENVWSFSKNEALLCGSEYLCYAIYPYQLEGRGNLSIGTDGSASFTYSIPSGEASSQKDILVAASFGTVSKSDAKTKIVLDFTHPLSAIKFRTTSEFKSNGPVRITLSGFKSSATCTTTCEGVHTWSSFADSKAEYTSDGTDTFIVIPQTLLSDAAVFVDYSDGGVSKRSMTSLKGITFHPGRATTFSIGKEGEVSLLSHSPLDFSNESEDIFLN